MKNPDYEKRYRCDWVDVLGEMPFLIWFGVPAFLLWLIFFPQDAHTAPLPIQYPSGYMVPQPQPITDFGSLTSFKGVSAYGQIVTVPVGSPQVVQPTQTLWSGWVGPQVATSSGAVVNYSPNVNSTTSNPAGYVAEVVGGQAQLRSTMPVTVTPPAGNVSAAAAAATAAAGAGATSLVKTAALGAGAGSLASALGKSLLLAPVAVLSSPYVAAAITAYQLWNILSGFQQDSSGQIVKVLPSNVSVIKAYRAAFHTAVTGVSASAVCQSLMPYYAGSASFAVLGVTANAFTCQMYTSSGAGNGGESGLITNSCPSGYSLAGAVCNLINTVPQPATSAEISDAVDSATVDPAKAAAIANAYRSSGLPMPDDTTLGAQTPAQSFTSPYTEKSTSTDSLGNVINNLQRHIVNISNGPVDNSTVQHFVENKTVVNNSTTNVTSTAVQLATAGTAAIAEATRLKQSDICVDHPEILACADITKTGDVPETTLLKKDISVSLTPVTMPSSLVCPPPLVFTNSFGIVETWDLWSKPCSFAPMMKPIMLAFAWLAAGMIVFVGRPYA